jgi:rhamnosyltransferase
VLLATYNGRQWLSQQLDTVFAQEGVEVHVMVGDDLSKDGTREFLVAEYRSHPSVSLCLWESSSGSAGANFRRLYSDAEAASFDFIALADQDDLWDSKKLSSAIHALERTGAHGYSCAVESFWPNGRRQKLAQKADTTAGDFLFEGAGQGCTFVMRQSLFLRIQDFCRAHPTAISHLHYHDWLVYLLARAWGLDWYFDPEAWMRYRQHEGNEIGSRGGLKAITKRFALISQGWYKKQIDAALRLFMMVNPESAVIGQFQRSFDAPDSFQRRIRLCLFLLMHGRRKLSERAVLAFASLRNYI